MWCVLLLLLLYIIIFRYTCILYYIYHRVFIEIRDETLFLMSHIYKYLKYDVACIGRSNIIYIIPVPGIAILI